MSMFFILLQDEFNEPTGKSVPTQEDIFGEELDVSSDEDDAKSKVESQLWFKLVWKKFIFIFGCSNLPYQITITWTCLKTDPKYFSLPFCCPNLCDRKSIILL